LPETGRDSHEKSLPVSYNFPAKIINQSLFLMAFITRDMQFLF